MGRKKIKIKQFNEAIKVPIVRTDRGLIDRGKTFEAIDQFNAPKEGPKIPFIKDIPKDALQNAAKQMRKEAKQKIKEKAKEEVKENGKNSVD